MEEKQNVYIIPENFIDEGRCIRGMFKTRNFIEGLVAALILGFPSLLIPFSAIEYKIGFCFVALGLPFAVVYNGFNGDATSVFLRYARHWFKNKDNMLYDEKLKVLKETPLDYMESQPSARDNLIDKVESIKEKVIRQNDTEYIEGETFVFEEDEELEKLLVEMPEQMRIVKPKEEVEEVVETEKESGDEIDLAEKLDISL